MSKTINIDNVTGIAIRGEPTGWDCPRCQCTLVWRYAPTRRDWYMGCTQYPKCRGSRSKRPKEVEKKPGDITIEQIGDKITLSDTEKPVANKAKIGDIVTAWVPGNETRACGECGPIPFPDNVDWINASGSALTLKNYKCRHGSGHDNKWTISTVYMVMQEAGPQPKYQIGDKVRCSANMSPNIDKWESLVIWTISGVREEPGGKFSYTCNETGPGYKEHWFDPADEKPSYERMKELAKEFGACNPDRLKDTFESEAAVAERKKAKKVTAKTEVKGGGMDGGALGTALWEALRPVLDHEIEQRAKNFAAEAVAEAGLGSAKITWTVNGAVFAEVEGKTHKALGEVIKRLKAGIQNIMLVGPAGSGKTSLATDVGKAVKARKVASLSCTAGMPEWQLVGRSMPNLSTGDTKYHASDFVDIYENGGVFLADEIDAADPNTLLVINSAIANGHMSLPSRVDNPVAKRHPDFIFLVAANTFGNGASRQYVGRNQLDASTLSRFACGVIEVDYDVQLERALVDDQKILDEVWRIRKKVTELGLRQVVGTRELIAVTRLVKSGESLTFATKAMTVSWTEDERTRVGVK